METELSHDLLYVKAQNERQRQTALERKHKCRPIRNYIERNAHACAHNVDLLTNCLTSDTVNAFITSL